MPILFQINVTANSGSHGRIAEAIGRLAQSQGWESHLAYGRMMQPSSSRLFKIGTHLDVYWHVLETRLCDNHGLASRRATRKLVQELKRIRPDIVHLQNINGYYVNFPILFTCLAELNVPVVWTLHDCWSFTGHCPYFTFLGCEKWKTGCEKCPGLRDYLAAYVDKSKRNYHLKKKYFNALHNLTLVPVSHWLEGLLKQSFLQHHAIRCIHNGIDLSVFSPSSKTKADLGITARRVVLGVSNVWFNRKGWDDMLQLRSKLPDDYLIIMVGVTKKQLQSLPSGIKGIVRTENVAQLVDFYSVADVLVNPTWEDNFPTINLEALACGTPVVTYRTGGSIEAIDEQTGRTAPCGDVEALCQHVVELCETPEPEALSRRCRERAVAHYDKDKCFQKYLDLYRELLQTTSE